jgi:hypothetical protein
LNYGSSSIPWYLKDTPPQIEMEYFHITPPKPKITSPQSYVIQACTTYSATLFGILNKQTKTKLEQKLKKKNLDFSKDL